MSITIEQLLEIYSTVFKQEVTEDDSFIDLGGDSFQAEHLCLKLNQLYQIKLSPYDIIEFDTPSKVLKKICS